GLAAAVAPLAAAAVWMVAGADGPLSRRSPVQVPAFVAEESGTRDRPRTLVLDGDPGAGSAGDSASSAAARVSYTLVRGPGARLGDGDTAREAGGDRRLDEIVGNLVAGSGADQAEQLSGYAVRYVLVRDGAPREMSAVLDATPGLSRLSQEDGSALWRVDAQVARATIVPPEGEEGGAAAGPETVAAGPVKARTTVPAGPAGRVLRIADAADPGWRATLDGRPLKPVTLDGWAQGFELPARGGLLELAHETPVTHTVWVWAQGLLMLVVLVMALPGRRREVDDDLPEETGTVPAQPVEGEGRRARRLRAAQEAADGPPPGTAPGPEPEPVRAPEPEPEPAARPRPVYMPQQQGWDAWDGQRYEQYGQYADRSDPYARGVQPGPAYDGGSYGDTYGHGVQDGTTYGDRSDRA
ncbi:family 2 glycosyl transferase, partial [Streptomyces sp. CNQ085]|nr:family 2 glycosyl transferase [Streptomyces sp. CNQ085]